MNEHENVVDRADALMRRRRFVAISSAPPAPPPAPAADDLPLLTEVIADDLPLLTETVAHPGLPDEAELRDRLADELARSLSARLACELGAELAQSVERRLAAELPTLVEAVLIDVGEQLRAGIAASVGDACRDFVRRHGPAARED